MALPNKPQRADAAPALARLLSESALSRAALGACGFPVAMLDATSPTRPITYVNPAFAAYFGWREADAIGRPLGALLFRGEDSALLADPGTRREAKAWTKDGALRHVELALGAARAGNRRRGFRVRAPSSRQAAARAARGPSAIRARGSPPSRLP